MSARVDVWDPSAEGPFVVEQLRSEGYDVRSVALADIVLTDADLVVMAGDAEGALGALKLLRDEGTHGDVPVILAGVPDGMEHRGEGPAFGADAVFARPITFEPLLRCVRRILRDASGPEVSEVGPAPVERTMRLAGEDDPASSQVFSVRAVPREPTMHLPDDDDAPLERRRSSAPPHTDAWRIDDRRRRPERAKPAEGVDDELGGSQRDRSSGAWREESSGSWRGERGTGTGARTPASQPGTGPPVSLDVPEPVIPPDERAQLSPWLRELLQAADRRVFPDHPALALHLPAADEPPDALVPAELLEARAFRIDEPVVDDPIDAFTYVGGPAVPPPAMAAGAADEPALETPAQSRKTSPEVPGRRGTRVEAERPREPLPSPRPPESSASVELETIEWPDDDTILGRPSPDGSRRGALGAGGALRLLWRIASMKLDGLLELDRDDAPIVRMTFLAGELRGLDGPVSLAALDALRRRGRATEVPADEAGAEAVLKRRVEDGTLSRFERDRLLREAREQLLGAIVRAPRAGFVLRRLDDTQPGGALSRMRVLATPLKSALLEAARGSLDARTVRELLGSRPVALALGAEREAGLAATQLPPELIELLVRMEGRTLEDVLAAAPMEPGLAGVLYALIAGDVLVLKEPPADAAPSAEAREAVRAMLESAAQLAEDGDYFRILGLPHDAADADVDRAHATRRAELSALPLSLLGLAPLDDARHLAIDALDEAHRALRDARRRSAYAAALLR